MWRHSPGKRICTHQCDARARARRDTGETYRQRTAGGARSQSPSCIVSYTVSGHDQLSWFGIGGYRNETTSTSGAPALARVVRRSEIRCVLCATREIKISTRAKWLCSPTVGGRVAFSLFAMLESAVLLPKTAAASRAAAHKGTLHRRALV